jgi:uncharacterized membrane protein
MKNIVRIGRAFYGAGIVGIGLQQLLYKDFRPVILPEWPSWLHASPVWAYLTGAFFIIGGVMIIFEKRTKIVCFSLAVLLLFFFIIFQSPFLLFINQYSPIHLGLWTNALKELAIAGGALVISGTSKENLLRIGCIFFSVTMIAFGIAHFYYTEFVATLVPSWMPGHIFWTYFAGVALICSGIAIILRIKLKTVSLLLATMLFLWLILLHIPRAIADPNGDKGNEVTSVFEALNFSGIALAIAFMKNKISK